MHASPRHRDAERHDLTFDAVDLIGRTGAHRHVERTVPAPESDSEVLAMQVPAGEPIHVEAELESVVEGIYVHGTATARLQGECSRCLDPVEQDITVRIDEMFMYPHKVDPADEEDIATLEGDEVDLAPLVHDALALQADDRPLCREDCPGLCGQCGQRMEDDPEHDHVIIDDRWAALAGMFGSDAGTDANDTSQPETQPESQHDQREEDR